MRPTILFTVCALCFALPAAAQEGTAKPVTKEASAAKIRVFGGTSTRACTSVVLFGENLMAGITITHGQPEWKSDYDNQFDKLKGGLDRLGKDLWTTMMTSVAVDFGGTKVPAGSYICGLSCSKDGQFALALMDSSKAMKAGLMPFGPQTWTPEITVPLTLNKDANKDVVSKMSIELKGNEQEPTKASFTIAWGKHTLTAPATLSTAK